MKTLKKFVFNTLFLGSLLLNTPITKSAFSAQKLTLSAQSKNKLSSFSETQLTVHSGEEIELTISNTSTDTKEFRNWVLTEKSAEAEVLQSAMNAGSEGKWTPTSSKVIAMSKLIPPGTSEVVNFKAPTPGEYSYFCTFPGYFMTMKGKLIVKSPKK